MHTEYIRVSASDLKPQHTFRRVASWWGEDSSYLFAFGLAQHSNIKCTNWIKSNCDVFRQRLTSVVQVGKAISLKHEVYSGGRTEKKKKPGSRSERRGRRQVGLSGLGIGAFLLCIRCSVQATEVHAWRHRRRCNLLIRLRKRKRGAERFYDSNSSVL